MSIFTTLHDDCMSGIQYKDIELVVWISFTKDKPAHHFYRYPAHDIFKNDLEGMLQGSSINIDY